MYLETVFPEIGKLFMCIGDSRSIDNQCSCRVAECIRYQFRAFFVMDGCSFFYQLFCQFTGRTVISAYLLAF